MRKCVDAVRVGRFGRVAWLAVVFASLTLVTCGALAATPPKVSPATTMAQAGMVDIRTLVPDIAEDMKYAGHDNFTGAPVPGYDAAKCFLLKPVAQALARVEYTLRKKHMRLKIWDCYRPTRAVAAFMAWAEDLDDQSTKAAHYPNVPKSEIVADGYVARVSNHSRATTVDLTLMRCDADGKHCHALDMGTHFDLFDPRAHTDSKKVTAEQHANREKLLKAMAAQGFKNYPGEWWHYTLVMHPQPKTLYNVPVR
ncbi:MAG TPA: M15 family metallopeptidase [Oleiagrimonas sp.]|nr:M15 family metallopeptidase [Oleiagrimonas sp.]